MSELPTGTVTFYFSDIEGSTRLIQQLGPDYPDALLAHHSIQREALARHNGHELRTEGDSFFIVFGSALDACEGAATVQRMLAQHGWPQGAHVRVRIGLHTGEAALVGNEYLGLEVHRAARIAAAAHGGQVLVSQTTRAIVEDALTDGMRLKDLGMHRLKDLARAERLYQLTIEGLPAEFPALRTIENAPNNLPTQLTSFIGRDDQVREAKALLARSRLVTLTGPGGTGKTRLSLQVAADSVDQFPDGVFFVPLGAVHDPELVPSAIAQALSVQTAGTRRPLDALLEYLHDKHTLLVLDNFEQLLPAAAMTRTLLEGSPELRVLVSSRAVLRVYGEQEFPVPPLAVPDPKGSLSPQAVARFEAVRLFIERAVAVKPDFQVTAENAPAIARICERVDGLPLAIELAAARVKLFSPQALLARLEKSLSVLGTGARDLPSRQQTLRGAIQWSCDLLEPTGRSLFEQFSVFARGASLEQAEAVCESPDVLDGLDQLADQSLLRRLPELDEPRFLMLQTIKEFAFERLEEAGQAGAVRNRHLDAYITLVQQAQPYLFGPERGRWLDRLELDLDNLRAALEWAIAAGDAARALTLGAGLWRFWQMRGHLHEGRARMKTVLAMPTATAFPRERLAALEAAGGLAYWQADMAEAQQYYDQCLELTRTLESGTVALANALYNAAFPRAVDADVKAAVPMFAEALALFRAAGDDAGVARALWGMGNAYYFGRQFESAWPVLKESEALYRTGDDRFGLAWALHTGGLVAFELGDVAHARRALTEAIGLFHAAGDVSGVVLELDSFSMLARHDRDFQRAARLLAASNGLQQASGTGLVRISRLPDDHERPMELTAEQARQAEAEGHAMSLDEAVAYALAPASEARLAGG